MFHFFKQKNQPLSQTIILTISGMHCSSCSLNIEGELEETPGVLEASAHYAKGQATVLFNPAKVGEKKLIQVIERLGYQVTAADNRL